VSECLSQRRGAEPCAGIGLGHDSVRTFVSRTTCEIAACRPGRRGRRPQYRPEDSSRAESSSAQPGVGASGSGHRFFMSFEPPELKRDQVVDRSRPVLSSAVFRIRLVAHAFGDVAMLARRSGCANFGCRHCRWRMAGCELLIRQHRMLGVVVKRRNLDRRSRRRCQASPRQ
jgi:hypothetical protein